MELLKNLFIFGQRLKWCSTECWRLSFFIFNFVLGVLLRGRLMGYSGRRRLSQQRPNDTTYIVQEDLSFVTVTLEKSPQLPLHQLSIIGKPQAPTDADVEKAEHSWAAQHAPHSAPGIQERNQALLRGRGYEACLGDAAGAAGMDPWSI